MRRLVAIAAVLLMAMVSAVPAQAWEPADIDGRWTAIDIDGSKMSLDIRQSGTGTFDVVLHDSRTALGGPAKAYGDGYIDGNSLKVDWLRTDYRGTTYHHDDLWIWYEVLDPDGVMQEDNGVFWYHKNG